MDSGNTESPVEVSLVLSKYPTPFHCLRCKCPMFSHSGGVIVSTTKESVSVPGKVQCSNPSCKLKYIFTSFTHNLSGATKNMAITIRPRQSASLSFFHCHECRTTVFQYNGDLIDLVAGVTSGTPVAIAKCPDSRCGIKFMLYEY